MTKSDLLSHINRYHLSGMVESVVWQIHNGVVRINFVSTVNSTAGEIVFPFIEIGSTDEQIGIFSTSALVKFLSIMQDHLEISFEKELGIWMKMNVTDGVYQGCFTLGDIHNIPEAPEIEEPSVYEVSFPIDKEFKDQYTKAYKALGSINRFTIEAGNEIKITLGNAESYANKVSFNRSVTPDSLPLTKLAFSGEALEAILKNNPDLSESSIEVSQEGLMKITVYGGSEANLDRVIYYLIQLEEV